MFSSCFVDDTFLKKEDFEDITDLTEEIVRPVKKHNWRLDKSIDLNTIQARFKRNSLERELLSWSRSKRVRGESHLVDQDEGTALRTGKNRRPQPRRLPWRSKRSVDLSEPAPKDYRVSEQIVYLFIEFPEQAKIANDDPRPVPDPSDYNKSYTDMVVKRALCNTECEAEKKRQQLEQQNTPKSASPALSRPYSWGDVPKHHKWKEVKLEYDPSDFY